MAMAVVTRFAPSPTGRLHLGHAASALWNAEFARTQGGTMLLRIEDIDPGRCREPFVAAILEDLSWLGLAWPEPVRRQSEHLPDYAAALERLRADGLIYPCFCTRADIAAEIARAGGAPHAGETQLYPGLCKALTPAEATQRLAAGHAACWRLHMDRAVRTRGPLRWWDAGQGWREARPAQHGDIVLARKDAPVSYHLAVTLDDALQEVTDVIRGEDLLEATDIHRLLQALLDLPTPRYRHHPLLRDETGARLAKRDNAPTLADLRAQGATPAAVHVRIGRMPAALGRFI